jgi:hypothetical protein
VFPSWTGVCSPLGGRNRVAARGANPPVGLVVGLQRQSHKALLTPTS